MPFALSQLTGDIYRKAHEQNMTLSMYLETLDPSPEGSKLDAFERLLKEAGIITQSILERNIFASQVDAFFRTEENKYLFPEYVARTLVQSMTEFPLYQYLVAKRTGINGGVYEAPYLDLDDPKNKKAAEMRRVTEAADLPKATLKIGATAIKLYKYGRAVGISYEAFRRMTIDLFQILINRIGTEAANNKVSEILTVIKDGDGNNNAAPVIKQTDLGAQAGDKLSRNSLVRFLLKFYPIGGCDTVVANEDGLLQILNVLYPEISAATLADQVISQGLNISVRMPQNLVTNFTLLYSPDIEKINGKEAIYGINKATCIEEVYELGSTIQEADINVINQTKAVTISETSGFRKIFKDSAKILVLD